MANRKRKHWRLCQACHEPFPCMYAPLTIAGLLRFGTDHDVLTISVCGKCAAAWDGVGSQTMPEFICERLDECLSRKETS